MDGRWKTERGGSVGISLATTTGSTTCAQLETRDTRDKAPRTLRVEGIPRQRKIRKTEVVWLKMDGIKVSVGWIVVRSGCTYFPFSLVDAFS